MILLRDEATDSGYDLALVTNDLTTPAPAPALITRYAWRWSIEVTFALVDFRFRRGGQHTAGALADDLVDQGAGLGGAVVGDSAWHGRAFPTRGANGGLLGDHHGIIREGTLSASLPAPIHKS
ncbi:hypothetical protein [Streptomyces sp. Ag109_O5-10]|uniref:hypothetical protein n=1 Tax=Streptomyces sp. Ag109_O5-10 TaxID=1855349 RepID=UPI00089C8A8A|nr:hypothetical protein [Streptomyces sp. Ag109_O5-10]SED64964.1 hypothetical protein SAMN05216533_0184 [Streptomyces sp. Ag109_O5-10]